MDVILENFKYFFESNYEGLFSKGDSDRFKGIPVLNCFEAKKSFENFEKCWDSIPQLLVIIALKIEKI